MKKEQALTVIKNIIDQAIKTGICPNLETTMAIYQAWQYIVETLKKDDHGNTISK